MSTPNCKKQFFMNYLTQHLSHDIIKTVAKDGVIPIIRNLKIKFNNKTIGEIR